MPSMRIVAGGSVCSARDVRQLIRRQGLEGFLRNSELLRIRGLHRAFLSQRGGEDRLTTPPLLQPLCHIHASFKCLRPLGSLEGSKRDAHFLLNSQTPVEQKIAN